MGQGEFDGGGSVTWIVKNSDGERGKGSKNGGDGKDRDPKGTGGMFRVLVNEELCAMLPVAGARIKVQWGPDALVPLADRSAPQSAATARKAAKSASKK